MARFAPAVAITAITVHDFGLAARPQPLFGIGRRQDGGLVMAAGPLLRGREETGLRGACCRPGIHEASVAVCSCWVPGPRRGGDSLPVVVTSGPVSADGACDAQARDSQRAPGLGGSARRDRPGARRPSAMTRGNPWADAPASQDARS